MMKFGSSILFCATVLGLGAVGTAGQTFYDVDRTGPLAGFGGALAVNGTEVFVGEPANVMRPGMVYVYRKDGGTWGEVQSLTASDGDSGDGFGASLATAGDELFVGGPMGVYAFTRAGDEWVGAGKLPAPAMLSEQSEFGRGLALTGDVLLVSAPGVAEQTGAVYVYRRTAQGWSESGMLPATGLAAGDGFGGSLAATGNVALVGAPGRDNRTGAVFAYRLEGDRFVADGQVAAAGVARNDGFGGGIFFDGDVAGIAALGANGGAGVVHAFRREAGEWAQATQVASYEPSPRAAFGGAMAMVDGNLWVGAPGTQRGAGAVYAFRMDEGAVAGVDRVQADLFSGRVQAGGAIAAGEGFVAVAAPAADFRSGAVVIFEREGGAWMADAVFQSTPEGFDPVRGGEVRCNGGEAGEWECGEVDLVSFVPVIELSGDQSRGIGTNDNWGWEDPETGHLYALVGMSDRASFVDITDVTNPVVVGILPMTEGANASAWRDIKTYESHAYIVSDGAGQHGMQVFDLTRLRDFSGGEPVVFDADAVYTNVASTHNIVINEGSGFAYAVGASGGGETCGGGLHMIDIRDPKAPTFAGCFADPQTGRSSTGYSHDAQCVMYHGPDTDYAGAEICLGANETALSIADVTDKTSPIAISRAAYPSVGYSHQGWLTDDHRYFFLNDELDELQDLADRTRTMIWDISDLDDPQLVAEHMGTQESSDHNLYIVGNLMYQSNYQSGLRILDISNPEAPVEVAYFDTVPYGNNGPGFGGSWSNYPFFDNGVVIVTSGNEGLFLVRPTVRRTVF